MQTILIYILILVSFARLPELYPSLAPYQLAKIAFVLSVISLFFLPKEHIKKIIEKTSLIQFIILLYVMAIISVPFSVWGTGALDNLIAFSKTLAICITAILLGAYERVFQYRFAIIVGVLLLILNMILVNSSGRISVSSFYDPNDIALLFVTYLPVILAEFYSKNFYSKYFFAILGFFTLICIVLTGSRGGIIALSVQALFFVLLSKKFKFTAIVIVLIGSLIVVNFANETLWERFSLLSGEGAQVDYNLTDPAGRMEIWKNGIKIVADNPVLGVGIGLFGDAYFLVDGKIGLTAHNSYLQIATELGIPGLLFYIALFCSAWKIINKHLVIYNEKLVYIRWFALKFSLVGFAVGSFFVSAAYSSILLYLLGLIAIMDYSCCNNIFNKESNIK